MAFLVGSCYKEVSLLFRDLPSQHITLNGDPLASKVLPSKLYLFRLREVDAVHSVQYKVNGFYIENLYSCVSTVTERVSECILGVTGGSHSAQQAAAAFRSCRVLETLDDVSKRTMAHPSVGEVCEVDPVLHVELPTFIWQTPAKDRAFSELAAATGVCQTVDDWKRKLYYDHIGMHKAAIAQQQQTICRLVEALSEQAVLMQLDQILRHYMMPKSVRSNICAKVAALGCLWTQGIPEQWLTTPGKATHSSHTKHPSCAVVEEAVVVVEEPAVVMQQPAAAVKERIVVVEEADVAAKEPVTEAEELTVVAEEPAVVMQQPAAAVKELIVVAEEAVVVAEEPAVVMQQPAAAVKEPAVVVEEADVAAKEPVIEAEELTVVAEEPAAVRKEHDAHSVEVVEADVAVAHRLRQSALEVKEPPVAKEPDVVVVETDVAVEEAPVVVECSTTVAGGSNNSSSGHNKGRLLFARIGKVVAAAGVFAASVLAARYGARVTVGRRLR